MTIAPRCAWVLLALPLVTGAAEANPNIDYPGFKKIVIETEAIRRQHRLSEAEFIAAMNEPDTVILDARSGSAYALRHVRGARNLPFTDFTAETLAQVVPTTTTKILIYCNNNFAGSPRAFPTKAAAASLNLSTYTSLHSYGYTNVYELAPLLDTGSTKIPFEGSEVAR